MNRKLLCGAGLAALAALPAVVSAQVRISELRIDQPGTDTDEFIELSGPAGTSLSGLSLLVIGDETISEGPPRARDISGVVEEIIDLGSQTIPADGFFLIAEDNDTFGQPADFIPITFNFENTDNRTFLLVSGLNPAVVTRPAQSAGTDLDTDEDGVLDSQIDTNSDGTPDAAPFASILDSVAIVGQDGVTLDVTNVFSSTVVGPDGMFVPAQTSLNPASGQFDIGAFGPNDADAIDTPGAANVVPEPAGLALIGLAGLAALRRRRA